MVAGALVQHGLQLLLAVASWPADKGVGTALCVRSSWPDGLCAAVLEGRCAAGLVRCHRLSILPQKSHLKGQLDHSIWAQLVLLQPFFPTFLKFHSVYTES